jgi:sulfite reductase beta subunit-like hemoprotein
MLRNPICQNLPRKWKTSFSCGPIDCAGSPFHDMGFIAKVQKDENGKEVRGFEVVVGGGLSTMPRLADTVWDFARADNGEFIRVAEACLKVFDKEGGFTNLLRKNMNKARVKFLLHKIGIEEFRKQVDEELSRGPGTPSTWTPSPSSHLKPNRRGASVQPGPTSTTGSRPMSRSRSSPVSSRNTAPSETCQNNSGASPPSCAVCRRQRAGSAEPEPRSALGTRGLPAALTPHSRN